MEEVGDRVWGVPVVLWEFVIEECFQSIFQVGGRNVEVLGNDGLPEL